MKNPLELNNKESEAVKEAIKFWKKHIKKSHPEPSPETKQFMAKIDEQIGTLVAVTSGLKDLMESHIQDNSDQRKENKKEHEAIMSRQDHTNGSVTDLEKWKYLLMGGWAITTLLVFPLLSFITYYIITGFKEDLKKQSETIINQMTIVDNKIQNAIEANNNKFFEKQ